MRIFPYTTSLIRLILNFESRLNKKPIVFDIHPNEFIDESNQPRKISRRTDSFLNYFLKDFIRSRLKVKNLGLKALPLYKREIQYFNKRNYQFITLKEYCSKQKLL